MENKKILDYFLDLVKIESPSGFEEKVSDYICQWLNKNKFNFKKDKVGNIIALHSGIGRPIALCAHMDTVKPCKNINPIIVKNKIIKSDGTSILGADNKASLAAILIAVENYYQERGNRSIELIFSVREEVGGGIENLPAKWIKSKNCFIFDHADKIGKIIIKSPYITNFFIKIKGKSAHSSKPKNGINSLLIAIDLIKKIELIKKKYNKSIINIGLLKSGTSVNTIPGTTSIEGEIRSFNKKSFSELIKKISTLYPQISFSGYCPGYKHFKNSLIKKIEEIYRKNKIKTQLISVYGVSDANSLNKKDINTICMSDGVKDPHTTKESISINNLNKLNKLIQQILKEFI